MESKRLSCRTLFGATFIATLVFSFLTPMTHAATSGISAPATLSQTGAEARTLLAADLEGLKEQAKELRARIETIEKQARETDKSLFGAIRNADGFTDSIKGVVTPLIGFFFGAFVLIIASTFFTISSIIKMAAKSVLTSTVPSALQSYLATTGKADFEKLIASSAGAVAKQHGNETVKHLTGAMLTAAYAHSDRSRAAPVHSGRTPAGGTAVPPVDRGC